MKECYPDFNLNCPLNWREIKSSEDKTICKLVRKKDSYPFDTIDVTNFSKEKKALFSLICNSKYPCKLKLFKSQSELLTYVTGNMISCVRNFSQCPENFIYNPTDNSCVPNKNKYFGNCVNKNFLPRTANTSIEIINQKILWAEKCETSRLTNI